MDLISFYHHHGQELNHLYPQIKLSTLKHYFPTGQLSQLQQEAFLQGKPVAYIAGCAPFYNHTFQVSFATLIPRPETEILVDLALQALNCKSNQKIIDIGTGCGNIIISIAEFLQNSQLLGLDISSAALEVAAVNWNELKNFSEKMRSNHVFFEKSDLLSTVPDIFKREVDLIVSNPPYIKYPNDTCKVSPSVHQFEPFEALYVAADNYTHWFENLFASASSTLRDGGSFLMEGSEFHIEDMKNIACQYFREVNLYRDLNNTTRFLKGIK